MGILTEDMKRVVERELGFVATVSSDGAPNLSPKGTIAVSNCEHERRVTANTPPCERGDSNSHESGYRT
jgi:hypothetical protein